MKPKLTGYENCKQNKWIIEHTPGDLGAQKQYSQAVKVAHKQMNHSAHSRWSEDTKATLTYYENCTQNKWIIQHTPGVVRTQKQNSLAMKIAHRTNESFSTLRVIWEHKSNTHKLWKSHTEMNHSVHSRWSEDTKQHSHTMKIAHRTNESFSTLQAIWGHKSNTYHLW
jgi:hypothetical protein